jgi:GT2 family glycosyltransferase
MDLSIIIVNWNSKDYVRKCATSIVAETRDLAYEIIVIDAASHDGCEPMLREHHPQVRFLQSDKNLGFARANNEAYALAQGDCVLFLNPDTELRGPAINIMYERLQSLPDAGAVGCKLLNTDGTIQTSCIQSFPTIMNQVLDAEALRRRFPRSALWGMTPLFGEGASPQEVEAVSGACVMLKRTVFEIAGRFSEDYFMYAEDLDLSFKVWRAGFRNYYTPDAAVVHHGGTSSQQAPSNFSVVMARESVWRFLRKTRGSPYALGYRTAMLISALGRLLMLSVMLAVRRLTVKETGRTDSFQKWRAILRWSLNLETWIKEYRPL